MKSAAAPMALVHLFCATREISRVDWLKHQCSTAVALTVPPTRTTRSPSRERDVIGDDDPELTSAYEAFSSAIRSPHDRTHEGIVVELEMSEALALIRRHGQPLVDTARRTGSFLYRGEYLGEPDGAHGGGKPRAVKEAPDLFDDQTYGSSAASEYFRAVDAVMAREFRAPARPATSHIMVADKAAAAAWGTPCSVWPLGGSLDYSWLDDCAEWWDPSWERPADQGSPASRNRRSFFWRDTDSLARFLATNLRVNRGLPEAIRCGHEVLVRSGTFTIRVPVIEGSSGAQDGGDTHIVSDAFVCIPASADDKVRSALGFPRGSNGTCRVDLGGESRSRVDCTDKERGYSTPNRCLSPLLSFPPPASDSGRASTIRIRNKTIPLWLPHGVFSISTPSKMTL